MQVEFDVDGGYGVMRAVGDEQFEVSAESKHGPPHPSPLHSTSDLVLLQIVIF